MLSKVEVLEIVRHIRIYAIDVLLATAVLIFAVYPIYQPQHEAALTVTQYARIRDGALKNTPHALILDRVTAVLSDYAYACGNS